MTRVNESLAGALFDLYGTTVDIEVDEDSPRLWEGLAATVREMGAVADAAGVREIFQTLLREEGARRRNGFVLNPVFRRFAEHLRLQDAVERLGARFRELSLTGLHLRPYVTPVFHQLRRTRVKIGLVSNTEALLTRFDLDRLPILRTADVIVLSSDAGVRKPDRAIFDVALARLHTRRAASVFVGNDWHADILGAAAAGLRAIYVNNGTSGHVERTPGAPRVIEIAPTFERLVEALRAFGWQDVAP